MLLLLPIVAASVFNEELGLTFHPIHVTQPIPRERTDMFAEALRFRNTQPAVFEILSNYFGRESASAELIETVYVLNSFVETLFAAEVGIVEWSSFNELFAELGDLETVQSFFHTLMEELAFEPGSDLLAFLRHPRVAHISSLLQTDATEAVAVVGTETSDAAAPQVVEPEESLAGVIITSKVRRGGYVATRGAQSTAEVVEIEHASHTAEVDDVTLKVA